MKAYAVPFEKFVNLADARLGTKIISVTDDWFADANRLFQPTPAVWKEGVFDDNGKWMDGWESRRKRFEGYDSAVIRLGVPGSIKGVDIDTSFFTGNFPPSASLEACFLAEGEPTEHTQWVEVLSAVELQGNSHHYHEISNDQAFSHLRFNIYPDGGVARLRVYGVPFRDWSSVGDNEQVDLAAALNGGRALACSDEHFGRMSNILNPGRGINMGDGWETSRRRTPGHEWIVVRLAARATIESIVVDTAHFKGNYPDACSLQAADLTGTTGDLPTLVTAASMFWQEILPEQKLAADRIHTFDSQIVKQAPAVTHVRLNIHPDGGISRLRVFGHVAEGGKT